ncbi:hypothetical protein M408DRAFT_6968 [Serendipita vermifera MAFF 305830]|uniref:Uncharacterized protein n=1 Tax=Serendipita vermifera MAFF 305830 TaxID=933852 RepID=A0A0C3BIQ1_SERVB|nr:hypothetical protein M408DRAFT_6968 [Serendipita vermifera MAFF 305830]
MAQAINTKSSLLFFQGTLTKKEIEKMVLKLCSWFGHFVWILDENEELDDTVAIGDEGVSVDCARVDGRALTTWFDFSFCFSLSGLVCRLRMCGLTAGSDDAVLNLDKSSLSMSIADSPILIRACLLLIAASFVLGPATSLPEGMTKSSITSVALRTVPVGRLIWLDSREGVSSWSVRLAKKKEEALRVESVVIEDEGGPDRAAVERRALRRR